MKQTTLYSVVSKYGFMYFVRAAVFVGQVLLYAMFTSEDVENTD